MSPAIRQIPVLHLSDGHRILLEIRERAPISIDDLMAAVPDSDALFKAKLEHKAPNERARSLARLSVELGLLQSASGKFSLTDVGDAYLAAGDPEHVFRVTEAQAEILRQQFVNRWPSSGMLYGAALAFGLWASVENPKDILPEDFGRALAVVGEKDDWREPQTFRSQTERYTALLQDARLLDAGRRLTEAGLELVGGDALPAVPPLAEVLDGLSSSTGKRVWVIRAGEGGLNEDLALSEGAAVVGWNRVSSFDGLARDGISEILRTTYADLYEGDNRRLGQATGQVDAFVNKVAIGDLVLLPRQTPKGHAAVGVVKSGYRVREEQQFQNDARHTRDVEWLEKSAPYARFDEELVRRFGLQGTVRQVHVPDAASRVIAAIAPTPNEPIHLVLKWSNEHGADTIDLLRERIDEHGAAWWRVVGKEGAPGLRAETLQTLQAQLADEVVTFAYLFGPTCWRTVMLAIQTEPPPEGEVELIAGDDPSAHGLLWVKVGELEPRDREWITSRLALASDPNKGVSEKGDRRWAVVKHRPEGTPAAPKVWWVNQGDSYAASRDGGFMWAPLLAKDGHPRPYWERLKEVQVGDLVLHYATGQVRAVSSVVAAALAAERPQGLGGSAWQGDGYLVEARYRELAEPVPVAAIPIRWRTDQGGPFDVNGKVQQAYFFKLSDQFVTRLASRFPQLRLPGSETVVLDDTSYEEPSIADILASVHERGMAISERMLRRYHASLKTRGFVILSGVSGTGKTWLAEIYAAAVDAQLQVIAVAPNWTTNEDLLGYLNPLKGVYHDTSFSQFLREAAAEYEAAELQQRTPRPFHVVLDEMNLARVEYYFAKFLSGMERRARDTTAAIDLAPGHEVLLTPNLRFIGTVNVDETTHGFADKVYDRAQLIELELVPDQLTNHMKEKPYRDFVMDVFGAVREVAPFAFRTLDEFAAYAAEMEKLGVDIDEAIDEQILQKVLPKLKGTDQRIGAALAQLRDLTEGTHPLSHAKVTAMLATYNQHGFASYF